MALTPKQEKFAQGIASGMSQSDAYRSAFDVSKYKPESIHQKASALMNNVKVESRVAELRKALAEKELWTREDSVRTLKEVIANDEARCNDITAAVKVLNDMHGYNAPQKIEHSGTITHEMALELLR